VSASLHKTLDEWQPGFELVGFGDELLDALLADGERGVRKFARVFLDLHAFQQAFQSVVSVGQARCQHRRHHFLEDFLRFEGYGSVSINAGTITATKGMDGVVKYGALVDDPDENLLVRLDSLGNLDINPTEFPGTDVQLVGISGIDTQAELAVLMSRVMVG